LNRGDNLGAGSECSIGASYVRYLQLLGGTGKRELLGVAREGGGEGGGRAHVFF
jgi:hypothetical protein